MLSIVLYGRNDSYGYNLHKRAALSLNCMAKVLSDPDDEIIFVDYNTPDDFPTFPEAIADTLTDKAKVHLRILRVRPTIHARFAKRTPLLALEPVARNVALRRANSTNRWILSTNTDMIFVPRPGRSLTEIARGLPVGHYGIPRFEIPETLWEALDRCDPCGVIESFRRWGCELHLNEVVRGAQPFLFDGPGDFQLIERSDLLAINGFHEDMLLGWHVDANIAKRLSLFHGQTCDLSEHILGYHCDHTRQVTPAHRSNAIQNDTLRFFLSVDRPDLPEQADSWGCPNDEIEEVRLAGPTKNVYLGTLNALLRTVPPTPLHSAYIPDTFNRCSYSPEHVLPFLLDILSSAPRHWRIGWIGYPGRMLSLFLAGTRRLGFAAPLLMHRSQRAQLSDGYAEDVKFCSFDELGVQANVFIFDFSRGDGTPLDDTGNEGDRVAIESLIKCFRVLVVAEEEWTKAGNEPRRFLGINAIHNSFEGIFATHVNCARTPFSVRIRHGYLSTPKVKGNGRESTAKPAAARRAAAVSPARLERPIEPIPKDGNWLKRLMPGPAGNKSGGLIHSRRDVAGEVAYMPTTLLPAGRYRVVLDLACHDERHRSRAVVFLLHLLISIRRKIGYGLVELRLRRVARLLLGRRVSAHVKDSLRSFLVGRWSGIPIVNVEIANKGQTIVAQRMLGDDLATSSAIYEFDLAPDIWSGFDEITMSITSNGAIPLHIRRVDAQQEIHPVGAL